MNITSSKAHRVERRGLDEFAGEVPARITKQQLRELSRVSGLRSALHIAGEWGLIAAAMCLCQAMWNPILYALTVAFIGARQHALLVLMHDGTHYRLFRNRRLNDWAAELLLAWPHLVTMRSYRQNHFPHHRYLNTDLDPDWLRKRDNAEWRFPQSRASLARLLLRDLSGIGAVGLIKLMSSLSSKDAAAPRAFTLARLGFYLAAAGAIVGTGGVNIFLLYWLVPYFTWLIMIMRLRSIAEHFAIDGRAGVYAQTRTTRTALLERIFIAPKNVNYHVEHHFYPSVPFYRLPELHALLSSKPEFRAAAHLSRTYLGVLRECLVRDGIPAGADQRPADATMAGQRLAAVPTCYPKAQ